MMELLIKAKCIHVEYMGRNVFRLNIILAQCLSGLGNGAACSVFIY
ncbi:MAG: hypothetical protein K0Q73_1232 [Paenibacillus sp.]|jgi:hypothetical protein|nr:hypothetical protein [Paenibacillus sp.]